MGDPLHRVRTEHFDAVFMLGGEDDEDTVDNVDVLVTLPDGTRYSATFLTLGAIERWMDSEPEEYERLQFQCPDLVITRYAGVPAMTRVLEMAHARGELGSLLVELDPRPVDED
ncbi:hypothetical protein CU044_3121 [Streptomyces sp. L-9-10]|uniref:hypothetical protein n=1 Tax=Streptomyces sp. L-9-10 TaxID=1478131 RepID=UPI00101DAB8B|nr:hypothetical protein [Streptomyces sp. L-9-10]RYJ27720.1 hypothetical protein CU044_3121 [Streptomyces sp. L-9-10]